MQQIVLTLIVLLGAVCAVACVRALWREARGAPTGVIMLAATVVMLTLYETGLIGKGSTTQFAIIAVGATIGLAGLLHGRSRSPRVVRADFLLPALVTFVLFFANAVANPTQSMLEIFARLAPLIFWLLVGVVLSTAPVPVAAVGAAMGLSLAVAAMASAFSVSWRGCDQFKCGFFGAIFRGPFPSENYLAQIAGLAAIAAFAITALRLRILILGLSALVLLAATSRTAIVALLASLVVGWILVKARPVVRRGAVLVIVVAGALASVWIVSTAAPDSFSNRGWIWMRSIQAVGDDVLLGVGIDRWAQLQGVGALPANNFPHNQLVLLFFAGGLVACAAYLFMIWRVTRQTVSEPSTAAAGFALVAYVLVGGITEVMWNPATIDGHCVPILLVLALRAAAMVAPDRPDDRDLHTRDAPHPRRIRR